MKRRSISRVALRSSSVVPLQSFLKKASIEGNGYSRGAVVSHYITLFVREYDQRHDADGACKHSRSFAHFCHLFHGVVENFSVHFVWAKHKAFQVFFYNRCVAAREIENITFCEQILVSIVINNPENALENIPPVRAAAIVVGQPLEKRSKIRAFGQFDITDIHISKTGLSSHDGARAFHYYGDFFYF